MKIRNALLVSALMLWSMGSSRASAEVLYDGAGFLYGTQAFSESFDLPSAGILSVTLTDVAWPQQLASLKMSVGTTAGIMKTGDATNTPFSSSFSVKAGDVFTQWFGTAQGTLKTGLYTVNINFQPQGSAVPLPKSIALFLSGIALLLWQRRIRSPVLTDRPSLDRGRTGLSRGAPSLR
jgi:hypothetical protein